MFADAVTAQLGAALFCGDFPPHFKEIVMTPLRLSMIDAMILSGFSPRTQESYVDAIARMSRYFGRDPRDYSSAEVEAYLLHLIKDRHLSCSTVNQASCACRFLFPQAKQTVPNAPVRQAIMALMTRWCVLGMSAPKRAT